MKRSLVDIIFIALIAVLFSGCYDRGIVDAKDFDHRLPKLENVNHTKQGTMVNLTWDIPADISPAFRRPLEIIIQQVENDIYTDVITVGVEGTSREIEIDPANEYMFILKLAGYLTEEARETGKPDRVLSVGQVVEIE